MVMFKIPVDKDYLLNRWKEYEQSWCDRFDDEPDYHIDLLPDGLHDVTDVVRFRFYDIEECEPDNKNVSEFRLDFQYGAKGAEDDALELFLTFDSVDHRVTVRVYIDDDPRFADSPASLIVSYSPKYGRKIRFGTSASPAHVRFVELLFTQALNRMEFTPEPPLDFDSVCKYAEKQAELDRRCEKIYAELGDCKHKVSEAWDNDFLTRFDR